MKEQCLTIYKIRGYLYSKFSFGEVYRRIYSRKFMTLSNQTSRCICKCIRIPSGIVLTSLL